MLMVTDEVRYCQKNPSNGVAASIEMGVLHFFHYNEWQALESHY
jgi:hypothetical protein